MEIHVKDNALNSLEVGLDFYKKFLNSMNSLDISVKRYGNLKFATIAIHNSIELFTKAILLDINEFLVFNADMEKDNVLCKLLREQYDNKKKKAHIAYHAVFSINSYKTIDYKKCISILHKIFNDKIDEHDYQVLNDLAYYRNSLTHLGYASNFEWYKILILLNKSLELLLKFYVENLIKSDEYFTKSIIKRIQDIQKISKKHIYDVWMASWEIILENVDDNINDFFNNKSIQISGIRSENEYEHLERIDFSYSNGDKDFNMSWAFKYSYLNDAVIIVDDCNTIVGSIFIDDRSLVFSEDEHGFPSELEIVYIYIPTRNLQYEEDKNYNSDNKGLFKKLELIPNVFESLMKNCMKNKL